LKNNGFYKTHKFKRPKYLGDPINILKIFNEKEVDEICILDIDATINKSGPNMDLLLDMASECFMPLSYGGGITNIEQMKKLFYFGFEKIVLNTAAYKDPDLVGQAADIFGSQSVVVSVDVKKKLFGKYEVFIRGGRGKTGLSPEEYAQMLEKKGAGEIVLNSIDNDGTKSGYDLELIKKVANVIDIPVIACGGASGVNDFKKAVDSGASAVGAGAMFVFHGPHNAVLINTPTRDAIMKVLK
jgi:cyclase